MYTILKELFSPQSLKVAIAKSQREVTAQKKALQAFMHGPFPKEYKKLLHLLMLRYSGHEHTAEEKTFQMQDDESYPAGLRTKAMVVGLGPMDMAESCVRGESEKILEIKKDYLRAVIALQANKRRAALMDLGAKGLQDTPKAHRLSELLKHPIPHPLLTRRATLAR